MIYYIGVGSSHPNGKYYIEKAYQELENAANVQTLAKSPLYPNPAFGGKTLFGFLNSAFKIETNLHPDTLWFLLYSIEIKLGRVRLVKNGPRTLDLDILYASQGAMQTTYLKIPHPEFKNRPFALKPAAAIGFR